MKRLKLNDLIEIEWMDAWGGSGWRDRKDVDCAPVPCKTVGYFIKRNDKGIVTNATQDNQDKVNDVHFTPTGMIRKIRKLR